jgi:hypothetical protein
LELNTYKLLPFSKDGRSWDCARIDDDDNAPLYVRPPYNITFIPLVSVRSLSVTIGRFFFTVAIVAVAVDGVLRRILANNTTKRAALPNRRC